MNDSGPIYGPPPIAEMIQDLAGKGWPVRLPRGERRKTHAHNQVLRDLQQPSAAKRRRALSELNEVEIRQYLDTAGQATQLIMPAGSRYALVIASPGGRVDYVTTLPEKVAAVVLRDLATHIDAVVAEGWTPTKED